MTHTYSVIDITGPLFLSSFFVVFCVTIDSVQVLNCGILKMLKMVLTAALFGAGHKELKYK